MTLDDRRNLIGDRLRDLRLRAGMSQRTLAAAVGADFTYLSKIEHGHERPGRPLVERLDREVRAGGRLLGEFDAMPCPRCGHAATALGSRDWRGHINAIRQLLVGTPPNIDGIDAAIGYALNDCEAAIDVALTLIADVRPCPVCGSTETVELTDDGERSGVEQSITVCAVCLNDEP